ncbi:MAG TPA: hypothetical protein VL357_13375 [Rariglobus sp.]|jgi:hypothetical protein|nr:hypothetical protein [Rariglobus sp.]
MSTTPTHDSTPSSAGDDRNLVPVDENYLAPSLEDRLAIFWSKHSKSVIIALVVVVLAVVAKGGYDIFAAQREKAVDAAYAAATTNAQLKAFVADHPTHALAGIAELRLADDAYTAGNYADAQAGYIKAGDTLGKSPFGQRARLGVANTLIQSGKTADGEVALKQLVADLSVAKALRAEAAYQLAALAADAGQTDEAAKFITQVEAIDPSGQWSQRATLLRARLPSSSVVASGGDKGSVAPAPSVNFKTTP